MLRNSKIGRMLLDLALERRTWSGLGMPDQDAIGEALLELMSLDNQETGGQIYRNECMRYMFLNPQSHALISGFGYVSANYGRCWMIEAERLQKRRSRFLGLINPLEGNLNALPYFRGFWQVPYGGWDKSFPAHTSPGFGLGTASREEKWREGANVSWCFTRIEYDLFFLETTPPKTNMSPQNGHFERKVAFQPVSSHRIVV